MQNTSQKNRLREFFTHENLSRITRKLLDLYRNKRYVELDAIHQSVAGLAANPGKVFASLIKLYHPDKLKHYLQEIEASVADKSEQKLQQLTRLMNAPFTNIPETREFAYSDKDGDADVDEDEDNDYRFNEDEIWTHDQHDFDDDDYDFTEQYDEDEEEMRDFLSALRMEELGLQDIEITASLLAGLEGSLDLSGYEIEDLTGLGYCENLSVLNLANNRIFELDELASLHRLSELYISNNHISDLSPLAGLRHLKEIDLAFNDVTDITPLLSLENLEFVNLIGNRIRADQIKPFQEKGVVIII